MVSACDAIQPLPGHEIAQLNADAGMLAEAYVHSSAELENPLPDVLG
jgi:hypothetical protein